MAEPSTFIKLDRNILEWRWYQDGNTARVFIHLILKANIKDKSFRTITVHRGELVSSYQSLASELGLSIKNVRTAIDHLKQTGEVAVKPYSKYSVISIKNYDLYQSDGRQTAGSRQTDGSQITTLDTNADEETENHEKVASKRQIENAETPVENDSLNQLSGKQTAGNWQADGRQTATTKESKKVRIQEPTSYPYIPTSSVDLADVEKNSDSVREPMLLTSEQLPELQAKLRTMTDFENLEGDFKRFTAATIGRLTEIISTGRVSKGKTVYPSELIKQLEAINEKEKSLIPFMSRLRAKCDKALSRLEDRTSCENYLRTVIVDFLLKYVPAPQAEQIAEETDPFSGAYTEILEAYNSICKSLPKVMMMSDKRRKAVAAKLQEGYTADQIKSAFELAEASPFLRGEVSTFRADFDWIFLEDNLLKILENKYEERKPAQSPTPDNPYSGQLYDEETLRLMGAIP